jgi:hypothetical protein
MAWEIYKPENNRRVKKPRVTVSSSNNANALLINDLLGKDLGFNSLTNFTKIRYDKDKQLMGLTFHQKAHPSTMRLGKRKAIDGKPIRSVNVTGFMRNVLGDALKPGTYNLEYERKGDMLVVDLSNLTKNED